MEKVFWFLGFSGVGVGVGNNILEVNLKIYSGGKKSKARLEPANVARFWA